MKNFSQHCEITREDFDSLFMWKVFWKLIRAGKPICFRSESRFNCRIFYDFDSFNRFNRQFFRKLKK